MKNRILLILFLMVSISAFATKLNQRGEKMVSRIDISYPNSTSYPSYFIEFGYDSNNEVNYLEYHRPSKHELAKIGRTDKGKIWRKDYFDSKESGRYTFITDVYGRPTQVRWFERDTNGVNRLTDIFDYVYNEDIHSLVIDYTYIGESDNTRFVIRMEDGNAYHYNADWTDNNWGLSYSDVRNDLNIDIAQVIWGYCHVEGSFRIGVVASNFLSLANWDDMKSTNLISTCYKCKTGYVFDGEGNLAQIIVRYLYTDEVNYTISITYVE